MKYYIYYIIQAADGSIPKTKGTMKTKNVPWWNDTLKVASKLKKIASRRYHLTKLNADKIAFNRARAHFRHLIKISKRDSWREYITSINEKTHMNKIWKKIQKIQGKYSESKQPILGIGNGLISDPNEVADV